MHLMAYRIFFPGVDEGMQVNSSNLVDAYKRSELEPKGKIGIFALSAVIVDSGTKRGIKIKRGLVSRFSICFKIALKPSNQ